MQKLFKNLLFIFIPFSVGMAEASQYEASQYNEQYPGSSKMRTSADLSQKIAALPVGSLELPELPMASEQDLKEIQRNLPENLDAFFDKNSGGVEVFKDGDRPVRLVRGLERHFVDLYKCSMTLKDGRILTYFKGDNHFFAFSKVELKWTGMQVDETTSVPRAVFKRVMTNHVSVNLDPDRQVKTDAAKFIEAGFMDPSFYKPLWSKTRGEIQKENVYSYRLDKVKFSFEGCGNASYSMSLSMAFFFHIVDFQEVPHRVTMSGEEEETILGSFMIM